MKFNVTYLGLSLIKLFIDNTTTSWSYLTNFYGPISSLSFIKDFELYLVTFDVVSST